MLITELFSVARNVQRAEAKSTGVLPYRARFGAGRAVCYGSEPGLPVLPLQQPQSPLLADSRLLPWSPLDEPPLQGRLEHSPFEPSA